MRARTRRESSRSAANHLPIDPAAPIWVRPEEACHLTGIGLTMMYKLIAQGKIESCKVGKMRLIRRSSLENIGGDE